jgi:DNA invertase Pin-like site-specific DNA recombinase
MTMKCAAYIRLSTETQTLGNQLPIIQALCQARGWELVRVYSETASAWKDGNQVELSRLLQDADKGKFNILCVWALDRISRGGTLAILQLIYRFHRRGVHVVSCQESFTERDFDEAEPMYSMMAWVARMESRSRSERTKAGLIEKRKHGKGRRGPDKEPGKRKRR